MKVKFKHTVDVIEVPPSDCFAGALYPNKKIRIHAGKHIEVDQIIRGEKRKGGRLSEFVLPGGGLHRTVIRDIPEGAYEIIEC